MEEPKNVSTLPAAGPRPNPNAYTAPCECCGQVQAVTCYDKGPDKDKLIQIATKGCVCEGAIRKRMLERAKDEIPKWFGKDASPVFGGPVGEKVEAWLLEGALLLGTGHLHTVAVKFNEEASASLKGGPETVDIARKRIKQYKGGI
jgi:hypothetical protein